ncbi:MAG: hypothetical protein V7642_274 [Burkholderiales bacterium]|jgi:hypothetical protein
MTPIKKRKVPDRNFPAYWLAMSDAAAFTLVRSVLAFALDLRRDLAEHAQLVSRLHPAEIAVLLLSASEGGWGKGKAAQLADQITDVGSLSAARAATVYLQIHHALSRLPVTAWPAGKEAARGELLDELRSKAHRLHVEIPTRCTVEEEREQQWLDAVTAGRQRTKTRTRG